MHSDFLIIGLLLGCGLFIGRVASYFGFPRVAAYLLVGMAFSPGLLGDLIGFRVGDWIDQLTTGALGIIAFLIGGSITIKQLRRMGKVILGGTAGESLGAWLFVSITIGLLLADRGMEQALPVALAFGVLAISTAPAATLAIIHQYRTKGPLTNTLLGAVALDDAIGIMSYCLLIAIISGDSLSTGIFEALIEIGGAVILGAAIGWLLSVIGGTIGESGLRLPLVLTAVFLTLGAAEALNLSILLAAMSLGFFTHYFSRSTANRLFKPLLELEETILLLFFILAGIHFDSGVFQQNLALIVGYFLARFAGVVVGATVGAKLSSAPETVTRWLGYGMTPQAGVAIGLALALSHQDLYLETGEMILNVILGTTLLFELMGPLAAYFALKQANEINIKRKRIRHESV